MKDKYTFLIIAILILAAPSVHANENCPDAAYKAVNLLLEKNNSSGQTSEAEIKESVVSSECKLWPYRKDILLVVLAYDEGVADEKTMIVATLNKDMRVTAHYKMKLWDSDVPQGGYILDTARYDLAKGIRAFGVRYSPPGFNAANSYHGDYLTLFVPEGKTLRPVFTEYMSYSNALTGLIGYPTGHEFVESGTKTISIAKSSTNGYADLIVTDTITYYGNEEDRPTDIKSDNRIETFTYRYDGARYR